MQHIMLKKTAGDSISHRCIVIGWKADWDLTAFSTQYWLYRIFMIIADQTS